MPGAAAVAPIAVFTPVGTTLYAEAAPKGPRNTDRR